MGMEFVRIISKAKHPNADTLSVYSCITGKGIVIDSVVCNAENAYDVDEMAIFVFNCRTMDGDIVKTANIRGIVSPGMLLKYKDGYEDMTDTEIEALLIDKRPHHNPWPSIESFSSMRKKNMDKLMTFVTKIKLDGTNAAVQIAPNDDVIYQSRERIITPSDDNYGFAAWASTQQKNWISVASNVRYFTGIKDANVTIYGEWAGPGIQKNVAVSQIPKKHFFIFAIVVDDVAIIGNDVFFLVMPEFMTSDTLRMVPNHNKFSINMTNPIEVVEKMEAYMLEIEKEDPYIMDMFDVSGIGEGFVAYHIEDINQDVQSHIKSHGRYTYCPFSFTTKSALDNMFKVKGEAHKVVKTPKIINIDPVKAKGIDDFAAMFVTESRLDQIAAKIGDFSPAKTSEFLKTFSQDVIKESTNELEASGLTWKDVQGAVVNKARAWWMAQVR